MLEEKQLRQAVMSFLEHAFHEYSAYLYTMTLHYLNFSFMVIIAVTCQSLGSKYV